jgi:hypothetical protein
MTRNKIEDRNKLENALYQGIVPPFAIKRYAWAKALSQHIETLHKKLNRTSLTDTDFLVKPV